MRISTLGCYKLRQSKTNLISWKSGDTICEFRAISCVVFECAEWRWCDLSWFVCVWLDLSLSQFQVCVCARGHTALPCTGILFWMLYPECGYIFQIFVIWVPMLQMKRHLKSQRFQDTEPFYNSYSTILSNSCGKFKGISTRTWLQVSRKPKN